MNTAILTTLFRLLICFVAFVACYQLIVDARCPASKPVSPYSLEHRRRPRAGNAKAQPSIQQRVSFRARRSSAASQSHRTRNRDTLLWIVIFGVKIRVLNRHGSDDHRKLGRLLRLVEGLVGRSTGLTFLIPAAARSSQQ